MLSGTTVHAENFPDITGSPHDRAIRELTDMGILEGYDDGTFRPENTVNRAEFLKILMDARFESAKTPDDLMCFKDLERKAPLWYARPVCLAASLGIVNGYPDGYFRPEQPVNLAEAIKMSFRSFGQEIPPDGNGHWYEPFLEAARNRNILTQLLKNPAHLLSRGEMAALTFALVNEKKQASAEVSPAAVCGNGNLETGEQCDDGNNQDSDGCSSICIFVPEPVRRAIIQIDQKAGGVRSVIAAGQKNFQFIKFTALSNRQDAVITSLKFRPSIGSLKFALNYKLVTDRDGDGKYETVVQSIGLTQANSLIFDYFEAGTALLPRGVAVPFAVTADLSSGFGPVSLGLEFATNSPDYIEAQGTQDGLMLTGIETDNSCTADTCFIRVNTKDSTNIDITERGNLFITQDTSPPRSRILIGGTETAPLLRLRLVSDGEDIDVRTVRFDGIVSSIEALRLYIELPGQSFDPAKTEPFGTATNGQCPDQPASRFCLNLRWNLLTVIQDRETSVIVTAKMKDDSMGATSGQQVALAMSQSTSLSSHAIEAWGTSSKQALVQNNSDGHEDGEIFIGTARSGPNAQITGKTGDTALAGIRKIENSGPAEELFIPLGQNNIGGFKISAFPHSNNFHGSNDVVLDSVSFQVTAQNVILDPMGYRLRSPEDPSLFATCNATTATGLITVTCPDLPETTIPTHIGQGNYRTYFLQGNITNNEVSPGSSLLQVTLPVLGRRGTPNSVSWTDESGLFDWVDTEETYVDLTRYRKR